MTSRYFVAPPITGQHATLAGAEAHHLLHVMRAKAGEEVVLFDGSGSEFTARVDRLGRSEVEVSILERSEVDRELPVSITLGVALPKGDRQAWLIEKATELGVARIVPLITERGVAQPTSSAIERLRRSVIEASKQCGRNRLMQIAEPLAWSDFLTSAPADGRKLIAHPGGDSIRDVPPSSNYVIAVGPEGGFTDAEISAAVSQGWRTVDLGSRILRVETAALYVTALAVAAAHRTTL